MIDKSILLFAKVEESFWNMAEQKRLEAALHQIEGHLARSQQMEALGRLAASVAHDFNTLVSVIRSLSQLLLSNLGKDNSMTEIVKQIEMVADSAALLTRQILVMSRSRRLKPRLLDMNIALTELAALLRNVAGKDKELLIRPFAKRGIVKADPLQIEQVVLNLVKNASFAIPHGGRIVLETSNVGPAGDDAIGCGAEHRTAYVTLAVTDSGQGMDAAVQANLFEPFFSTKPKEVGTGLGLSIVYGIIQDLGGFITVSSKSGCGSTFKVFLPCLSEVAVQ